MMELFKQWVILLLVSAIIGELFLMIVPNGNVSKMMKVVVSVFFLGSFLSPFIALSQQDASDLSFDFQTQVESGTSSLDETMQKQTIEQFVFNIEKIVTVNLSDLQVEPTKIDVIVNTEQQTSIQIECITIWLDASYKKDEKHILDRFHNVFGYKTQYVFEYIE